jgi:hypothetical protein
MATTTPNYGWTVPTSTDLVKDGATAIETLGDAIDASMNTALGTKKAMGVLLSTVSFSAVASQSLPASTFNSTYTNYKILFKLSALSTNATISLRLRASGTDATGANYSQGGIYNYSSASTVGGLNAASQTLFAFGGSGTQFNSGAPLRTFFAIEIADPFLASETVFNVNAAMQDTAGFRCTVQSGLHDVGTSYDSASIFTGSGTMSGVMSVYGFKK